MHCFAGCAHFACWAGPCGADSDCTASSSDVPCGLGAQRGNITGDVYAMACMQAFQPVTMQIKRIKDRSYVFPAAIAPIPVSLT